MKMFIFLHFCGQNVINCVIGGDPGKSKMRPLNNTCKVVHARKKAQKDGKLICSSQQLINFYSSPENLSELSNNKS